jgi:hypothetical protein
MAARENTLSSRKIKRSALRRSIDEAVLSG